MTSTTANVLSTAITVPLSQLLGILCLLLCALIGWVILQQIRSREQLAALKKQLENNNLTISALTLHINLLESNMSDVLDALNLGHHDQLREEGELK